MSGRCTTCNNHYIIVRSYTLGTPLMSIRCNEGGGSGDDGGSPVACV